MTNIKLISEGKYFSGRSHASQIVEKYCSTADISGEIRIDFAGVESFSQSFISELFVTLKVLRFDLSKVAIYGFHDEVLASRASKELERIKSLPSSLS